MQKLLLEYKRTLKETTSLLKKTEEQLHKAQVSNEVILVEKLQEDKKIIRSWISNLNYCIKWIKTGRCPGTTRGIENRAAYDREISVNPQILQQIIDDDRKLFIFEPAEESLEKTSDKEQLVKEIMKVLDKKEQAVFELAAKQFSQRAIANYLGLKRVTVQKILDRCKRKIEGEGWFMP